ncbi:MAG TPA: hypothetical protein VG225_06875 [Terracidiphilus sp.]|jgi:hypothetical protein|nr:hypothetical protein [Terracidiphilus sp.]
MQIRTAFWLSCFLALPLTAAASQQPRPAPPARPAAPARSTAEPNNPAAPAPSDKDVASTQRQLIELLRLSPTLTTVVSHDPSLLADQDYVSRNNPQLAEFLAAHPEVARNPDFYLFTHMHPQDGSPDEALEHEVWPEVYRMSPRHTGFDELLSDLPPLLAFACFLAAAIWGIRVFVENRRWGRMFKLQSDVHGRLIDKFSSSQELAAYMETDAGKRFLEAAPIPLHADSGQRVPNAVARVLTPIQIGVVLVLLGIGFLLLRNAGPDYETPMRVLGVLILMPGIGFILSAGITWFLANRMGLMPPPGSQANFDQRP